MDDIELTIRDAGRPSEWNGLALLPFPERATYVRLFNVGASRARFFLSFFSPMHAHAGVYVNIYFIRGVSCECVLVRGEGMQYEWLPHLKDK